MQKKYCDLCSKEIREGSLEGGAMRLVELWPIKEINIIGMKRPFPPMISKSIQHEIWDLCESCQKELWANLERKQREINNEPKIAFAPHLIKEL